MGYFQGYIDRLRLRYPTLRLTAAKIRNASPRAKPFKIFDERGLFLLVNPSGSKLWRLKYKFNRREKSLSFGCFPDVSLSEARTLREEARAQLRSGIDPSLERRARRESSSLESVRFETVAREWFAEFSPNWAASYSSKVIRRLETYIFPSLGRRPINQIGSRELLLVLKRIQARGALDTAHRTKQICGRVFRHAIVSGLADRDPTADLRGALPPAKPTHHPTITDPAEIGALLRAIDGYDGQPITRLALQLMALVFVRSRELRAAEWCEMKLESNEWRIPALRMKMEREHVVPLSTKARSIIAELHGYTGNGKYVFPCIRSRAQCMSSNTLNAALRRLGYACNEMTTHGFRSMASTLLNEMEWNPDAIERQLAHAERNGIRAAYNYADYLPKRHEMMQFWADYLDELRANSKSSRQAMRLSVARELSSV